MIFAKLIYGQMKGFSIYIPGELLHTGMRGSSSLIKYNCFTYPFKRGRRLAAIRISGGTAKDVVDSFTNPNKLNS
jgi:hypothetical protein